MAQHDEDAPHAGDPVRRDRVGREGQLAVGTIALAIAPAFAGIIAARSLGPDGRGQLAVLLALGTIGGSLGMRGYDTALLASPHLPDGRVRWIALRRRSALVLPCEGLVAAVACVLVLGTEHLLSSLTATALASATTLFLLVRASNLASDEIETVRRADFSVASIILIGACLAGLAGLSPAAFTLPPIIGLVVGATLGSTRLREHHDTTMDVREMAARLRSTGRPAFAARSMQAAALRLDRVVLAATAGSAAAGVYAAIIPFAEMATIVPLHLSQLVTTSVAGGTDVKSWYRLTTSRIAIGISVIGVSLIAIFAGPIVDIVYGYQYVDGVSALRLLALASLVSVGWRLAEAALFGDQRARAPIAASVAAAVIVLGLTAALSDWGADAPAIASLIGYSAALVIASVATRRSGRG